MTIWSNGQHIQHSFRVNELPIKRIHWKEGGLVGLQDYRTNN